MRARGSGKAARRLRLDGQRRQRTDERQGEASDSTGKVEATVTGATAGGKATQASPLHAALHANA